jgi:two-component system phosphate regulon sensor histidine kinase PhoR
MMPTFPRYLLLALGTSWIFWWAGGLDGFPAQAFRALVLSASALLAVRWHSAPWKQLDTAARRVLEGDFSARLDDVRGSIPEGPARTFNEMAEHLADALKLSREREDRVTAVLAASDRAVLLLDGAGAVSLFSPATARLFPKFRPEAGLASLSLPGLSQLAEEVIASGQPVLRVLEEGERGRGRAFAAQVVPLAKGAIVLYLGEVTEDHRLERVKADLVANVSHELRTPLTATSGLVESLGDPGLTAEKRSHFQERLEFQVRRMQALVDDLLSLSRLESGPAGRPPEPVALGRLLGDVIRQLQPLADQGSVKLEMDCPEDLSLGTDPFLLETALRNLVENGIRYNRSGGSVTLAAFRTGGRTVIRVEDTGEGIPGTHLPRIFERFYRVDPHRSREKGGTGLGLAITKHAVVNLGGEITVESTVGMGSVFAIKLPDEVGDQVVQ